MAQNGREWDMKTSWDWLKIGINVESCLPTFLKKTSPDDNDDDDSKKLN